MYIGTRLDVSICAVSSLCPVCFKFPNYTALFSTTLVIPSNQHYTGFQSVDQWSRVPTGTVDEQTASVTVAMKPTPHASTSPAALASCTTANIFQAGSTGISMSEGSCPDVSEWQPAPCRRSFRSTTFAFCVINGSCCATDTSSNSRWSSVLCCGCKHLERSSFRSDVISDTVDI